MPLKKRCACRSVDGGQLGAKCPELKRPDGTWNPKHGKWGYSTQVFVPGRGNIQLQRTGYDTRAEAQAAMDDVRSRQSRGEDVRKDQVRLREFMPEWLDRRTELSPSTLHAYRRHMTQIWLPHLGHAKVSELRSAHIAGVLRETTREGSVTRARVKATISSCLSDAVLDGLCQSNPAARVKAVVAEQSHPEVWTAELEARWRATGEVPGRVLLWRLDHLVEFLDAERDSSWFALWWILSHRGLRRGEALGLRWHKVDLSGGTLTVDTQRTRTASEVFERRPKSRAGRRTIGLGARGVEVLREHRKRQLAHTGASEYVFTNSNGDPYDPQVIGRKWRHLLREYDLPPCRVHDLRHLCATLMHQEGADMKVIQTTLGHSNYHLTANTYTSVLPDVAMATADLVSGAVARAQHPHNTRTLRR